MEEKTCPNCGGYVYKRGVLEMKPYQCVRCERSFSYLELEHKWFLKIKESLN